MKLSKIVLLAIRGSMEIKDKLAKSLDVSPQTIYRWINDNDDNLTKAASLQVIREELGLTDSEILETEVVIKGL